MFVVKLLTTILTSPAECQLIVVTTKEIIYLDSQCHLGKIWTREKHALHMIYIWPLKLNVQCSIFCYFTIIPVHFVENIIVTHNFVCTFCLYRVYVYSIEGRTCFGSSKTTRFSVFNQCKKFSVYAKSSHLKYRNGSDFKAVWARYARSAPSNKR